MTIIATHVAMLSLALASVTGAAVAQDAPAPASTPAEAPAPPPSERARTHVAITPYLWLTGITGSAGARGLSFDVDESFGDILDSSETLFGLMGALDIVHDRFVFQLNGTYTAAEFVGENGRATTGPLGGNIQVSATGVVDFRTAIAEAMAGYRIIDTSFGEAGANHFALDAFGGVRYTDMELDQSVVATADITLPNGIPLSGGVRREVSGDKDWVEPLLGLRGTISLDDHWEILLRGDIGGFGVDDSEFSWQLVAGVGYTWRLESCNLTMLGGYRALGQDYDDGSFAWDVVSHGPVLGLSFRLEF